MPVSVLVVTYNCKEYINACLDAIKAQTIRCREIIVVDNNSSDGTIDILRKRSEITLIERDYNSGFTGGVNHAFSISSGRYIALINPDACPEIDWLESLLKKANDTRFSDVGIFASKIINIAGENRVVDSAGDGCTTYGKGFKRGEGEAIDSYNSVEYVFGACGGAMLIKREMIEEIGFLDDYMFLIHDDTDFCMRAQMNGSRVLYVPDAIVYHHVRSSIKVMSDMAVYYSLRNADYVWLKLFTARMMLRHIHEKVISEIANALYFIIRKRKASAYFRAKWHIVIDFPLIIKKRREFFKTSCEINTRYMSSILTPLTDKYFIIKKLKKLFI
jgi:GT2 family glycosyltransferase